MFHPFFIPASTCWNTFPETLIATGFLGFHMYSELDLRNISLLNRCHIADSRYGAPLRAILWAEVTRRRPSSCLGNQPGGAFAFASFAPAPSMHPSIRPLCNFFGLG